MGFVVCMRGLVGFVWVGGGGESLVGREARARGLVMETQEKQYMVSVSATWFLCLLLSLEAYVGRWIGYFFSFSDINYQG